MNGLMKILTISIVVGLAAIFCLGQMQDNPVTESGDRLVNSNELSQTAFTGNADSVNGVSSTNYFAPSYAEGWATNGTMTLTNQGTYYAWSIWTPGDYSSGIGWTNNGVYIADVNAAGMYQIVGQFTFSMNVATEEIHGQLWKGTNGVATAFLPDFIGASYSRTADEPYPLPMSGLVRLELGDYLECRFANKQSAGKVLTGIGVNFHMVKTGN